MVMDFIDHDLKALMEDMKNPFLQSEVKTIMIQLLSAVALMHDNWMIHRDLKTSNLLLNNRGQIKVADFGLARTYGSPLGNMTQLVVTLWYRYGRVDSSAITKYTPHRLNLCIFIQSPGTLARCQGIFHCGGHVVNWLYICRTGPERTITAGSK